MLQQLTPIHKPQQLRSNATILRAECPTIEAGLPRIPRVRRIGDKRRRVWTGFDPTTPGGGASMGRAA